MRDKEAQLWHEYIDNNNHCLYNNWHYPSANDLIPTGELNLSPDIDCPIEYYCVYGGEDND